jgi:hypothetical protein
MTNIKTKLRASIKVLIEHSPRYPAEYDREVETILAPAVRARGWFTKPELEQICRWKSPRSQKKVASNSAEYIEAVTRTALSTESERLRIEVLTLLNGVSWPTASVILHFCHTEPYPILDVRALWTLGVNADQVTYDFELWWEYVRTCRQLAKESGLSMRELDRALWQYSKENQK